MDCTAPLALETLIKRAVITNAPTLCSVVLIGNKDIGDPVAFDCTQVDQSWQTLLAMSLFEGDSAFATDVVNGDASEMERIDDCGPAGLETMFRRVLQLGTTGTRIRAFSVPGVFGKCTDCDEAVSHVPLLTRMLGTVVKVDGVYRVRVQSVDGSFPEVANVDCAKTGISPLAMLAGAISYDDTTKTWYWSTTQI